MIKRIIVSILVVIASISVVFVGSYQHVTIVEAAPTGPVRQLMIGGCEDDLNPAATEYESLFGSQRLWTSATVVYPRVVSTNGTISELAINLTVAPGAGKSYTFNVIKNGVASGLEVSISGTNTTGENTDNSVDVVTGDEVQLRCTPSGTPAVSKASWSTVFLPDNISETIISAGLQGNQNAGLTLYASLHKNGFATGTENSQFSIMPTSGTISRLYVELQAAPGNNPGDKYTFTLRKNGTNTSITTVLDSPATTAYDFTHSVAVNAGDNITLKFVTAGGSLNGFPYGSFGLVFTPTVAGQSVVFGGSNPNTTVPWGSTAFVVPSGGGDSGGGVAWTATESTHYNLGKGGFTLSSLYVRMANGDAGMDVPFTLRVNSANTTIEATMATATNLAYDTTHKYILEDGDFITLGEGYTVNHGNMYCYWSFVIEALAVSTNPASDIWITYATLNGGVDCDGGENVSVRFQYGLTTSFGTSTSWQGGKETGDNFTQLIESLSPGTLYYFKAQVKSSLGVTVDGITENFTTLTGEPIVVTLNAYNIGTTQATVKGYLQDASGTTCSYQFQYGLTAAYGDNTTFTGNITAGLTFTYTISGLNPNTTYHYRAQCRNTYGTGSGADATFTTGTTSGEPSYLLALPTGCEEIQLSWVKGDYSPQTYILYKTGTFPANTSDGEIAYAGAESSCVVSGLEAGKTYYFMAWGLNLVANYSTSTDNTVGTTYNCYSGASTGDIDASADPDTSIIDTTIFHDIGDWVADSTGMGHGFFYGLVFLMITALFGIGVAVYTRSVMVTILAVSILCCVGIFMHLVSVIFLLMYVVAALAWGYVKGGQSA